MKGYLTFFVCILCLFLASCEKTVEEIPDVAVNPEFEMFPPIADDVFIKRIDDDPDNVLVMAKFSDTNLKSQFLALNVDDQKIVLRDDGKDPDETAGDFLFTVKVKADMNEIEQQINTQASRISVSKTVQQFRNRSLIIETVKDTVNIDRFQKIGLISIKHFLLPTPEELLTHSLMITSTSVVEDPGRTWNFCNQSGNIDGPWTFNTIVRQLASQNPASIANDQQVSDFVLSWLNNWASNQVINGENVDARNQIQSIITSWRTRSQTLSPPLVPNGQLDMRAAPFKLIAIVNRLDLRGNIGYGTTNAGEGRFVFCLMDSNCNPRPFTVIFEYGIPKRSCSSIKAFAKQWYDLKNHAIGSTEYNQRLEEITDQFTKCGTSPQKPNQSSLNQLRTNEIALAGPWELREFTIDNTTHMLKEVTTKQEPAKKFNGFIFSNTSSDIQQMVTFVNSNESDVLANKYSVPEMFGGINFLSGKSHTTSTIHIWNDKSPDVISSDEARHIFSLNTCSGCHGGETRTIFTHINPAPFNSAAGLSGFLTGITVTDPAGRPVGSPTIRTFNDIQRRADDLQKLVESKCLTVFAIRDILRFIPVRMSH